MRWPWKRKPVQPDIPPFKMDFKAPQAKDPNYVVTESEMTETGIFRLFPWRKKTVSGSCTDEAKSDHLTPDQPSEQPPKRSI